MTDALPRYRYWGDQKPNARLAELAVTRAVLDDHGAPRPVNEDEAPTVAVLRIYAPIDSWGGWWGVSADDVASVLDTLPTSVEQIILRINSPGGEVWEAMTILNMVRAHKAKTLAVVDGIAASAASFIAAGCDETIMSPGSQMMIHDARIFAAGDPAFLRKVADRLEKDCANIASIYVEAAGGTEADWRVLMAAETWYTAKEAADAGLADRVDVVPDAGPATSVTEGDETDPLEDELVGNVFDLSQYRYPGRAHAPAPAAAAAPRSPAASADGSTPPHEGSPAVAFSDAQVTDMRRKLGVAEDADEATIMAALDEALDERADAPELPASNTVTDPTKVVVSKAEWEEMRGDAKRGAEAAKRLHEREREACLDAHRDKFLPANREAWRKEYDLNPKATLEALKARPVVIPLDELGHEVDADTPAEATLDEIHADPVYKNWSI